VPGFDTEDKNPSLGDPSTQSTTPLSSKQMKGAQQATVNRTQQPSASSSNGVDRSQEPMTKSGQTQAQIDKEAQQPGAAGAPPPGVEGIGQIGSALAREFTAAKAQADATLNLNPAHAEDWWKHALESPVEAYYIGRHIYNAYYGAFLDSSAIERSVHNIWGQDNAVGWLLRQTAATSGGVLAGQQATGASREDVTAGALGMGLPAGADPSNLLVVGRVARGFELTARFLGPSAASAIFTDQHSPSDLAWGILPAILFGGKLPHSVSAEVEKIAPAAGKVFERLSAARMAQEANKVGAQDREKMLQELLRDGSMPAISDTLAKQWEAGMTPLSKEESKRITSAIQQRYGTLDANKVIPNLIRDGASPRLLSNVWTKLYRMNYDLNHVAPEEAALVDPRVHIPNMPAALAKEMQDGFQWAGHMIHQGELGTAGHAADPVVSRFRSLLGMQSTDKLVEQMWTKHLLTLAGDEAKDPAVWDALGRALESSGAEQQAAYESLSVGMKAVRDEMRLVAAGIGKAGQEIGQFQRVTNYWPRVGLLARDAKGLRPLRRGGVQPLSREPLRHRTLAVNTVDLLTESRMQVEQAYKTVKEANAAVARQRNYVVESILNDTPWYEIVGETGAGVPKTDYELIQQIQQGARNGDPAIARMEAEEYAKQLIPEFSENPFDGIPKLGRTLRAITSQYAIEDLLNATGKDGKSLAIRRPTNDREWRRVTAQGYSQIKVPGFQHVLVNAQYGQLLEDAARAQSLGHFKKLAELENKAVTMIMYSPRIHGLNMAARLGIAFALHPLEVSRWFGEGLLQKGGLSQLGLRGTDRIGAEEYRMIPRRYGLVPPNPDLGKYSGGWADSYIAKVGDLFGDTDLGRTPLNRDMSAVSAVAKASSGAKEVMGNMRDLLWGKQSELWSWVSDFGNMMWWIEYAAAQRGGTFAGKLGAEEAARYATARANSWMGHVAPVDWNPNLHALLKTAAFAPNWWRTWAELLTGYYRNQGFGWSPDTIKYVVENEIKTALAAVAFQQLSANALNMVFSGHTIYQNDPGNWGKIEITNPWVLELLNQTVLKSNPIDTKTGRDPKGAKLTWENPIARQMVDTEQMMGFLTSSPSWTPETMHQGFSQFLAARTSPVAQSIAALFNIDLYRTIASEGSPRYVDPNHDTLLGASPITELLTAGGDLTPFANISQQIQQQVIQGNVGETQGPFGLPIPKAVTDSFTPQSIAGDLARSFLIGLTGMNPPFMRSSKTEGVTPTDDQYKAVHELQTKYQQQMNALSTSTLSGQMAPYQWLASYRQLSAQHAAEMQALFLHAPEYNNGPLGLTNSWENLYDQATDKTGVLDADKLRSLQQQWRAQHSQADYAAVQSELRGNDQKYPMVALYHKTLDAYDNWQRDWCLENGVDLSTLQSDMSGWSKVYADRNASRQWLLDHPEITEFENAKKTEFESGNSKYGMAGLMYALFFNPTAADRYLTTSGETIDDVIQQVENEQVPAAP
jgi:hypothetical protein